MKEKKSIARKTLRKRELILVSALIISTSIATGPGVLMVNRPETVLGFPIIYVWGVAWYVVIGGLAIAADRLVWSKDSETEDSEDDSPES